MNSLFGSEKIAIKGMMLLWIMEAKEVVGYHRRGVNVALFCVVFMSGFLYAHKHSLARGLEEQSTE